MEPATGMATLGTVVTQMITWFTSMMSSLFAEPLFLVLLAATIVSITITLVKRVIS